MGSLPIQAVVEADLKVRPAKAAARALALPLAFTLGLASLTLLDSVQHNIALWRSLAGAVAVLLGDIPLMDSPLSINTKPMGETMAQILGRGPAVLLKAHGVVVVGADVVECFALAAYVEENAYRQYMAMQIGEPYVFSEAEQKASREKLWTPSLFKKTWDHYRSKI